MKGYNKAVCIAVLMLAAQSLSAQLRGRYLFYLHGKILEEQGKNAVSPVFGRYEYDSIISAFTENGFQVLSEIRPAHTDVKQYAAKLAMQIDSLIRLGVVPERIIVVGASKGAAIAVYASELVKIKTVKYVLMGLCGKDKGLESIAAFGNFLSIYEASDFAGSCRPSLGKKAGVTSFDEIVLHLGNGHGFLYKPYREWLNPMLNWINKG